MYTKRQQGEIYHVIEYNRYTTWHDQPLSRQSRRFSILKKNLSDSLTQNVNNIHMFLTVGKIKIKHPNAASL